METSIRRWNHMSDSDVYVILMDFHDGRRDISDVVFQTRNDAQNHAQTLENCKEVMFTIVRRANIV